MATFLESQISPNSDNDEGLLLPQGRVPHSGRNHCLMYLVICTAASFVVDVAGVKQDNCRGKLWTFR